MAKVQLVVEIKDPKALTVAEQKEQNRRWFIVQKLLKKNA